MGVSNETYGRPFADIYDRITTHKEYDAEVDALDRLIRAEAEAPEPRILDVGCGTGTHSAKLAGRGYDVTAIDLSPEMARRAQEKAPGMRVLSGDVAELDDGGFDFSMSLFNVVNCILSLDDLSAFFGAIAARLAPGGVLLVESWNPIAVIADPPTTVERTFDDGAGSISRTVTPHADFLRQRLDLRYDIVERASDGSRHEISVTHELLLFTPLEIEFALRSSGFEDVAVLTALPDLAPAGADDRMLAFTCRLADAPAP